MHVFVRDDASCDYIRGERKEKNTTGLQRCALQSKKKGAFLDTARSLACHTHAHHAIGAEKARCVACLSETKRGEGVESDKKTKKNKKIKNKGK